MERWLLDADTTFTILLYPCGKKHRALFYCLPVLYAVTMKGFDALCNRHSLLVLFLADWIDFGDEIEFEVFILSHSLIVDVKIDTLVAICERLQPNFNRLFQLYLFLWSCHDVWSVILFLYSATWRVFLPLVESSCQIWFPMLTFAFLSLPLLRKTDVKIRKQTEKRETKRKQETVFYVFLRVSSANIGKFKSSLKALILSAFISFAFLSFQTHFVGLRYSIRPPRRTTGIRPSCILVSLIVCHRPNTIPTSFFLYRQQVDNRFRVFLRRAWIQSQQHGCSA